MWYRITPLDPLISRDARPFGAGNRVRSLEWLSQTVIAGAVRTTLWKQCANADDNTTLAALRNVEVRGAFPVTKHGIASQLCFPRPLDIIASRDGKELKPWQISPSDVPKGCHVDMPLDKLRPAEPDTQDDFKPEKLNPFWTRGKMIQWLKSGKEGFDLNEPRDRERTVENAADRDTLAAPSQDERIHVNIDPQTGTAQDGMLFSTTGLDFVQKHKYGKPDLKKAILQQGQISIDVNIRQNLSLPSLPEKFTAPLGGERRLAEFERMDGDNGLWDYPCNEDKPDEGLPKTFLKGAKLRLVLATPAIFSKGWLPGWIDEKTLTGKLPEDGTEFKLVSAVTGRWQPISGWSYEKGNTGPKPLRRAVPAGSVYFLELLSDTFTPSARWLRSVCDNEQDRNDGFGLALWANGFWKEKQEQEESR